MNLRKTSRIWSFKDHLGAQISNFYLFTFLPFYLGEVGGPGSGPKTVHFTFLPFYIFTWGWSDVQNKAQRQFILPLMSRIRPQDSSLYLFTWGLAEVLDQAPRRLISHFTFLPAGWLRSRISPKTAHSTFLPLYHFTWGVVCGPHSTPKAAILPFNLFTWALYEVQNQAPRQFILSFYLFIWG